MLCKYKTQEKIAELPFPWETQELSVPQRFSSDLSQIYPATVYHVFVSYCVLSGKECSCAKCPEEMERSAPEPWALIPLDPSSGCGAWTVEKFRV